MAQILNARRCKEPWSLQGMLGVTEDARHWRGGSWTLETLDRKLDAAEDAAEDTGSYRSRALDAPEDPAKGVGDYRGC